MKKCNEMLGGLLAILREHLGLDFGALGVLHKLPIVLLKPGLLKRLEHAKSGILPALSSFAASQPR